MKQIPKFIMMAGVALVLPGCGIFGVTDIFTGAEAGVAFIKQGKYESFDEVAFEDAVAAARRAGVNLSYKFVKEKSDKNYTTLKYLDTRGQEIAITLERRTATLSACYIDVGILGTTGVGRVTLAEYINQLLTMHAYKQTWEREQKPPATGTQPVTSSREAEDDKAPLGGTSGLLIPQKKGQPVVTMEPDRN